MEAPNEMNITKMQRGEMICPQGTQLGCESARSEPCALILILKTLLIYHVFIYLFLVRSALGESHVPCDLTSAWQCFGNKLDSHGSPNGGRVPMSGKVFFIMKKKQK